jgi:hypothetical protein
LCIIEHTPIYRSLADELENTKAVCKESGTSFFSNLTKTIKSITTDSDVFNDIIQVIAELSVEPVELNLGDVVFNVSQMQCLQDIKTLRTLRIQSSIPDQLYSHKISCSNMTKLVITVWSYGVYIDWLLSAFPSLKELVIIGSLGSGLTKSSNYGATKRFPNLRKFTVGLNLMDQSCLDYLRMALPNIKELSIKATRT